MHPLLLSLSLLVLPAQAREIVFPPVAAIHNPSFQRPLAHEDTIDIVTGSQFSGLTTFANLPYVNCFVDDDSTLNSYDIAFLGAPFDTVSHPSPLQPTTAANQCRVSRLAPEPDSDPRAFD